MINIEGQSADLSLKVRTAHRTARLIVLAFAASIVAYVLAGYLIASAAPPKIEPTQVPIPFYAGAIFLALGSIAYRRAQMHRFKVEAVALKRGLEGLIKHFVKVTIISAALAEAIGVLALMTVFFGGDSWDVMRLGIVALAITLYNYPRRAAWQETVDYFAANLPK